MVVEYTRYRIDAARRQAFETAYEAACNALSASPHCLAYELSHAKEEPSQYVLRIERDSEDGHLKGFRSSPEFQTFFPLVRPFVNDIQEMWHYAAVASWKRSEGIQSSFCAGKL
jgi:quinol monooxygenase YgiN